MSGEVEGRTIQVTFGLPPVASTTPLSGGNVRWPLVAMTLAVVAVRALRCDKLITSR